MEQVLDELASGELSPEDTFKSVRAFLAERTGREPSEQVYDAVRGVVWQIVSSREKGEHVLKWQNTLLKLKQLIRRNDVQIAERFVVLADFLAQSARFHEIHAPQEIRQRKHVMAILEILVRADRPIDRKVLLERSNLKAANLSRVLSNLAAEGLVKRRYSGRDVEVLVTAEGRSLYTEHAGSLPAPPAEQSKPAELAVHFTNSWPRDICSAAVSSRGEFVYFENEFRKIFADREKIAGVNGWTAKNVRAWIAATADSAEDGFADEVAAADGKVYRIIERQALNSLSIWLCLDVTDYRRRLDIYERRERHLKRKLEILEHAGFGKTFFPAIEDALHIVPAMRRDLLAPTNAIYLMASSLLDAEHHWPAQANEALNDIQTYSRKIRDFARAVIRLGDATAHELVIADRFTPDEILMRVIDNLSMTLTNAEVVVHRKNKVHEPVLGDELAMRSALTTTLAGIAASNSKVTSVSVKQKLTDDALCYDVYYPMEASELIEAEAFSTSMLTCSAAVKQLGLDFRFNSTREGYRASILAPFGRVVREATKT